MSLLIPWMPHEMNLYVVCYVIRDNIPYTRVKINLQHISLFIRVRTRPDTKLARDS